MNKADAFIGNYGNLIGSVGTGIASFINANKKQDPTGRPYKTGTNMIKSKKSKLIKYQTGVNSTSSQVTQPQGEVGPTRKEAANLMRKYNQDNRNNPNVIGVIDEDTFNKRSQELMELGITKPIMKSTPPSLLNPKQVSFTAPEQPSTSPRLNKVPIEKPSRRERRKENKRLEALSRAPITYTEPGFVGPINQEPEKKGTPFLDDIIRRSMSSKEFKNPTTTNRAGLVSFKDMTPAQQKQYRAGIASGKEFTVEGIGKYRASTKQEKSQSARMTSKGGNKPLIKMSSKANSIDAILDKYDRTKPGSIAYNKIKNTTNNPVAGSELVRMSRMGKANQNNFYTPGGLPIPIKRKILNTNSNQDSLAAKIENERKLYKQSQEEEQKTLRERKNRYMEKLKKEDPEKYKTYMEIDAQRKASKSQK